MKRSQKLIQILMALTLVAALLAPVGLQATARPAAIHPALAQLASAAPDQLVRVIALKADSSGQAEALVEALGGTIYRDLKIINAFAAELTARAAEKLSKTASVNWVTLDGETNLSVENTEQEIYYLFNNPMTPTGDTAAQPVLPMDLAQPPDGTLFNYDVNRDSAPGLIIQRGGSGAFETDPAKIQRWQLAPFTEDYMLQASVRVKFYAVMEGFQPGLYGKVNAYLIDRDGSTATVSGLDFLRDEPLE